MFSNNDITPGPSSYDVSKSNKQIFTNPYNCMYNINTFKNYLTNFIVLEKPKKTSTQCIIKIVIHLGHQHMTLVIFHYDHIQPDVS